MSRWLHPNRRLPSELPPVLRRTTVPTHVREWIRRQTGAGVAAVRRLPGASSTAVHGVRLSDGRVLVLRRYVWDGFLMDEPDAPARELEALHYATGHGLPAPLVVAADVSGQEIGDGIPALLMQRLPGRSESTPDVRSLAALAARVHDISGQGFGHAYFPWCLDTSTRPPAGCRDQVLWRDALEVRRSAAPTYQPCFVHRDFHPGNVLWRRGKPTGIVDWANACVGPAGIDIATCRWNLADWTGGTAGDAFVAAYETLTGRRHERYWDVAQILEDDWDVIDSPERIQQAERFLAIAMR